MITIQFKAYKHYREVGITQKEACVTTDNANNIVAAEACVTTDNANNKSLWLLRLVLLQIMLRLLLLPLDCWISDLCLSSDEIECMSCCSNPLKMQQGKYLGINSPWNILPRCLN